MAYGPYVNAVRVSFSAAFGAAPLMVLLVRCQEWPGQGPLDLAELPSPPICHAARPRSQPRPGCPIASVGVRYQSLHESGRVAQGVVSSGGFRALFNRPK